MTEVTVSTRIPHALEQELEEYMEKEHVERSAAVRKLLYDSLQRWREANALRLLAEGKVTISKAAELAGMDIWCFMTKIKETRTLWVKDSVVLEDLEAFS